MAKIQPCNKGCRQLITVQFNQKIGKYAPYDVDQSGSVIKNLSGEEQLHNCPNSEYNKQEQQGQTQQQPQQSLQPQQQYQQQPQIPTDRPSIETVYINQLHQKIDELQKKLDEFKYFTEQQIYTLLKENVDISKNTNMMCDAIVAHLKITEPKPASELYNNKEEEQQQVQEYKEQQEREIQ